MKSSFYEHSVKCIFASHEVSSEYISPLNRVLAGLILGNLFALWPGFPRQQPAPAWTHSSQQGPWIEPRPELTVRTLALSNEPDRQKLWFIRIRSRRSNQLRMNQNDGSHTRGASEVHPKTCGGASGRSGPLCVCETQHGFNNS